MKTRNLQHSRRRDTSRTSHAAALSCVLHCVLYIVLSVEWMRRVPVVDVVPLLDDATLEVSFVVLEATEPVAVTVEASAPAVVQPPQPAAPDPSPTEVTAPPPKPRPEPRPDPPAASDPEPEPPPEPPPVVVTTPTTAELLEPDDPVVQPAPERQPVEAPTTEPAAPANDEPVAAEPRPSPEPTTAPETADAGETSQGDEAAPDAPRAPLTPDEQRREQIGEAMSRIARAAAGGSASRSVDIVFLLDLSGSMENNLRALGQNLSGMMQELQSRDTDATFGIVKFKRALFVLFKQTTDVEAYERLLRNLSVGGDEHALDAMDRAATKVKFRPDAQRRFVLITDEPLKGDPPLAQLLPRLIGEGIVVDVIGLNDPGHRILARRTGGTWHRIPGDRS